MSSNELTPQQQALRTHLADVFSHDPRPLAGEGVCERPNCTRPEAYTVPSHGGMGGDDRVCRYHTAVYRDRHPDVWEELVEVDPRVRWVADDCDLYTCWEEVPPTQQIRDAVCEAVALTWTGIAIYEDPPSDGDSTVDYYSVGQSDVRDRQTLAAENQPVHEFIDWVRTEHGLRDVGGSWGRVIPNQPFSPITFHGQGGDGG